MEDMDDKKQLADWCAAAAAELGLAGHELTDADLDAILGLAGVAAHNVLRPAAPLTTFLAGYAIGLRSSADGGRGALDGPVAKLSALAQAWDPATGTAAGHPAGAAAAAGPAGGTVGGSVAGHPAVHDAAAAPGGKSGQSSKDGESVSGSSNGSGNGPGSGAAESGGR
jgi:hypothetical protein